MRRLNGRHVIIQQKALQCPQNSSKQYMPTGLTCTDRGITSIKLQGIEFEFNELQRVEWERQ